MKKKFEVELDIPDGNDADAVGVQSLQKTISLLENIARISGGRWPATLVGVKPVVPPETE